MQAQFPFIPVGRGQPRSLMYAANVRFQQEFNHCEERRCSFLVIRVSNSIPSMDHCPSKNARCWLKNVAQITLRLAAYTRPYPLQYSRGILLHLLKTTRVSVK